MNAAMKSAPTQAAETVVDRKLGFGVVRRGNAHNIDPKLVRRRAGWNARFDMGEIELLAASIKTEYERDPESGGLLHSIRVKRAGDVFELIDGDRRFTAIELLMTQGVPFTHGIPAKIVDKSQDDLTSLIQMLTANTGKPLIPIEEAGAYKRMRDAGMTIKAIELAVGRSDNSIVSALALLDADVSVTEGLKSGALNADAAKKIAVVARGDLPKQKELAEEMIAAGKDRVRKRGVMAKIETQRRAKAGKQGRVLKMRALSDDQLSALGERMAAQLKPLLAEIGVENGENLREAVGKEGKMAAAFTLGALFALKAAAGLDIDLAV